MAGFVVLTLDLEATTRYRNSQTFWEMLFFCYPRVKMINTLGHVWCGTTCSGQGNKTSRACFI